MGQFLKQISSSLSFFLNAWFHGSVAIRSQVTPRHENGRVNAPRERIHKPHFLEFSGPVRSGRRSLRLGNAATGLYWCVAAADLDQARFVSHDCCGVKREAHTFHSQIFGSVVVMGCKKKVERRSRKKNIGRRNPAAADAAKMIAKEKTQICSEIDFFGDRWRHSAKKRLNLFDKH